MKFSKPLATIAIAALLSACASSGVKVTEDQTSGFVKGQTTRSEVISKLGKPTMQTRLSNGTRLLQYTYAESSVRASTFIPIVGAFVGGADTSTSNVQLSFDEQDRLTDITHSEGEIGSGTGFAAGAPAPAIDQPRK